MGELQKLVATHGYFLVNDKVCILLVVKGKITRIITRKMILSRVRFVQVVCTDVSLFK